MIFLGLKILRIFFRALETEELKIPGFYADWADPTYKLLRALALMFLLVAIFPLLPGADDESFKAISIFVGALISLGSTGAMKNAIAGVVLIYTRAFQIGDWIQVNKSTGEVVRRNLLVTHLRTKSNEQVTIPNGEVLKDHVVNYTPAAKKGRLGFSTSITIGYDVDWRTVNELLLKAAKETPALSSDPPPFVFQSGLDDFYASYTIRVYTSGPPPLGKIQTALRQNILDVFHQAGVEIRTPVFEASMKTNQRVFPKEPNRKAGSD
jgi:small-conductance mechanosensitive channel